HRRDAGPARRIGAPGCAARDVRGFPAAAAGRRIAVRLFGLSIPKARINMKKKTKQGALKLSIETLKHLALEEVPGGKLDQPPPLPSGCRAGCFTTTVISH